ncbi:MAG TPA: nickel-dependent lactate racemase [Bacteroidota bacterium]
MKTNIALAYGKGMLNVELRGVGVDIIEPKHQPGLPDERGAVLAALDRPLGVEPLREWLHPDCKICITFTDLTRATPNERIIPWLLEYLESNGVRRGQIILLNQLGTHRPNTKEELERMLTPAVVAGYRVMNHEPENVDAHVQLGVTESGARALLNRHYVEADVRITTGFIEPHLFAGFSGGVKGIMPGIAALETISSNHGYRNIADPRATFGVTEGNPTWEEMHDIALRAGRSFLLNVALNNDKEITGVFAGHLLESHKVGCEFVRESAMQRVAEPYDIVISTNSGYPLDLNLYQTAKGISAAALIVKEGGTIIVASECCEGIPPHSDFERLLHSVHGPDELLHLLSHSAMPVPEQWQAHIQARSQQRATVLLYSSMSDEDVRAAHLIPCHDIAQEVQTVTDRLGTDVRIAVLPQGPLTIPYLAQEQFA